MSRNTRTSSARSKPLRRIVTEEASRLRLGMRPATNALTQPRQTNGRAGPSIAAPSIVVGRYELGEEIGVGGMATVHLGRILGDVGFTRRVAIKRLHPHLARDPAFVAAFVDEAHLAVRISHPNVVATLDVISAEGELLLVMEYVAGASLSHLLQAGGSGGELAPVPHVAAVMVDALAGLQAAHDAVDENGKPLGLVHRDVSPQNIMVGFDGRARMLDFGVAKATGRKARERTRTGVIKGKLGYVAPEQFDGTVSRQSDIYAAAVVLWEALAGRRLFDGDTDGEIIHRVLSGRVDAPSVHRPGLSPELDALVLRGLSMEPSARFLTADEMATALRRAVQPAVTHEVAEWVERLERKREVVKPPAGGSRSPDASRAGLDGPLPEIPAVSGRSLAPKGSRMLGGALLLALGVGGAAIAMRSLHSPPNVARAETDVASAASASQPHVPPPPSAQAAPVPTAPTPTLAPTPTPARAPAPAPKGTNGPPRRVSPGPRSSPISSVPRSQSAKIYSVLDTRQ
jgi:serine/threonine protein kinase